MSGCRSPHFPCLASAGLALVLAACGSAPVRAPVEARGTPAVAPPVVIGSSASTPRAQAPAGSQGLSSGAAMPPGRGGTAGAENAGKPGHYTVKPGDTLIRVSLDHGQNWRDVARWNAIENPNLIEVGQVLRVAPPEQEAAVAAARTAAAAPAVRQDPAGAPAPAAVPGAAPAMAAAPEARPVAGASSPTAPGAAESTAARAGDEAVDWAWPATGSVVATFDEARGVKGVSIAGRAGDPVLAAADGRVVYAGSGLRGYGNLVIVKHNNTFLTAYAHNQALLVKEEQAVRRGQKIAEMGSTDAERVKLHFEIRRQGRPVDPAKLLPAR
jgi:lipoprotein NlpD